MELNSLPASDSNWFSSHRDTYFLALSKRSVEASSSQLEENNYWDQTLERPWALIRCTHLARVCLEPPESVNRRITLCSSQGASGLLPDSQSRPSGDEQQP